MIKVKANTRSLSVKLDALREKAEAQAREKLQNVANDAAQASPVDTGAFVESWSVRPKGSGGGRSRSSKTPARRAVSGKLTASQKQALREKQKGVLAGDIQKFFDAIIQGRGAIVVNRAPHQPFVEARRRILPYVVDRNS